MYCQECWTAERKEIMLHIDGVIVLVRFAAQRFKELDEDIKKYTIKLTKMFGENAHFIVSYNGLVSNNRPVYLRNRKCGCMVWEHTEMVCHHLYQCLRFLMTNHPTHPLTIQLDSSEK